MKITKVNLKIICQEWWARFKEGYLPTKEKSAKRNDIQIVRERISKGIPCSEYASLALDFRQMQRRRHVLFTLFLEE